MYPRFPFGAVDFIQPTIGNKMQIVEAKVDWSFGWANEPSVQLKFDEAPPNITEIPHRKLEVPSGSGTMYFGHKDGFANFLLSTSNHEGYGGRKFTLLLESGEYVDLHGPWSSRAGIVNMLFSEEVVEVAYDYVGNPYQHLKFHGAMLVNPVRDAFDRLNPMVELRKVHLFDEEPYWLPAVKGKPGKWEINHGNSWGDIDYLPDEVVELAKESRGKGNHPRIVT